MAKEIVIWPEKILNAPTKPVTDFGPSLEELLGEMTAAVREAEGVGIAANQIGVSLRVALVSRGDGTFFEIINPQILAGDEPVSLREGCLSVPEEFEQVERYRKVRVRFQDKTSAWTEQEAEGQLAHVFQHEIDHLNGIVYVMHLSNLKRGLIRDRMEKLKRARKQKAVDAEHD
jgi:peptide deformylase